MKNLVEFIVQHVDEGIIAADENFNFTLSNKAVKKILGRGADATTKKNTHEDWSEVYGCYYPDQVTPFKTNELPLARACRGEKVDATVLWIKNEEIPNGIWLEAYAKPLHHSNGKPAGGIVVFRDISKVYEIQKNMEKLKVTLESIEKTIASYHYD